MLVSLTLEPILTNNEYHDVLTIDHVPSGPIIDMVRQIRTQDLSIFEQGTKRPPCKYVLIHPTDNQYLTKEDIPFMFSYLLESGYTVDTQMTKLYKKYSNTLVCLFSDN
jgi:hypothetical protein